MDYRQIPSPAASAMQIAIDQGREMRDLLSGSSTFAALRQAVAELTQTAPKDHDVLIQAFGIIIDDVKFIKPHTFIFSGINSEGHKTMVTCHFSQLVAQIVYIPKRGESRVITGFANT